MILGALLATLVALVAAAHYMRTTFLLGAFMAGDPHLHLCLFIAYSTPIRSQFEPNDDLARWLQLTRTVSLDGMPGVCFSAVPEAVRAFDNQMPPIANWTSRVFFASIGLVVPVGEMLNAEAAGYGALLTVIAVASKVVTG